MADGLAEVPGEDCTAGGDADVGADGAGPGGGADSTTVPGPPTRAHGSTARTATRHSTRPLTSDSSAAFLRARAFIVKALFWVLSSPAEITHRYAKIQYHLDGRRLEPDPSTGQLKVLCCTA
ncbi:hypothetical protein DDJ31_12280 [Streptomyces griseoviridis]|uniref:Uncharacterized protein n=1 Tax=Streptomyces griseoviridis TaxID=45398 RepID=A0ABX5TV93_STRGD|nr:hypothetical protein DDJ31_12280 [Streptomyces griseoviridis]